MNEEKITGTEKEFLNVFKQLCISRSSWQVWADLMAAMACTLANSVNKTLPAYAEREKEYTECIERLGGVEKPAKCFAIVVDPIITYLLKRCEEDQGLAEDVMQDGKTWNKCFDYIVN